MKILIAYDGSQYTDAAIEDLRYAGLPLENDVMVVSVADAGCASAKHHPSSDGSFAETLVAPSALVPVLAGGASASEGVLDVACAVDARELARLRGIGAESLERLEARGLAVSTSVLEGNPRIEVVAKANRWRADTIFVGSRGLGGLDRLLLGSVSTAVVTHARCTVEVVRKS